MSLQPPAQGSCWPQHCRVLLNIQIFSYLESQPAQRGGVRGGRASHAQHSSASSAGSAPAWAQARLAPPEHSAQPRWHLPPRGSPLRALCFLPALLEVPGDPTPLAQLGFLGTHPPHRCTCPSLLSSSLGQSDQAATLLAQEASRAGPSHRAVLWQDLAEQTALCDRYWRAGYQAQAGGACARTVCELPQSRKTGLTDT